MICYECGRQKGRICFPPIPTCTCDESFEDPGLPSVQQCPVCKRDVNPIQIYDEFDPNGDGCTICHGVPHVN